MSQELCKSRGGRPGLPVPNGPYGLYGRKAILNLKVSEPRSDLKEVELGSHSELDFIVCFRFQLLVFGTLSLGLCSEQLLKEHELLCTGEVPHILTDYSSGGG